MIYIATDNFNDGFPLSNAYDDTIYQKANSEYYLKFRFPVDRLGVWKHLTCETVLKADDTRGLQLFKIKKINKVNGYIRVFAKHISDDLNFIGVDKIAVSNATGRRVMEALAGSTTEQHNFIFNSDIATMHTLNLSNTTAGKVLSKDKHSILGQWGGELIRDNFLVDLKARAGVDTEILFMNKKNVKNLDNVVSTENLTTRLKLTVEKEHEGKKQTITATVDSPNINAYPRVYTNYLKVNNDKSIETQQQLIEYGAKYFKDSLVDFPTDNLTVNVIDKNQEQVNLFDTVWFRNVDFNIDKRLKVVAYEYSPMAKRYKKISFGALKVASLGQIKSLSQLEDKIEEKVNESFVDAFKIQKNLSELLKSDRKGIEDKLVELEEKSKGAIEVKKALFETGGTIPDVVKTKILDAVEGDIGRLKTIITEAELIKAIQAKLNYAEIKNALIDKAFINQIISDEKFTQQFEEGQVTTQNIFTKLKDSIKSNISKEFLTKDETKKLVNDLTVDADGIRQITQQEITNRRDELKGKSSYIHARYSDNANGSNFDTNSNRKYIGVYTGEKQQAPTNASEYSWTKIKGEDGKSYARNYLSETAEEKILTLTNNNYVTQEIFKLVENKTFRDLGFKAGDKVTFIADYEVLPNGNEKRISRLNFEWHDDTRFRVLMNFENAPTKGTYTTTITVDNNLLDCKRAIFRADNVNAKIKITNARLIQGDTVQPWSIAQEDLQGHTLTANVRFEGTYINNVTNNLKIFLDVYYDGRKVALGFNAQIKYKGGNRSDWSAFTNANVDSTGRITNIDWGNREQNGEPIDVIVLVTYKDKDAIASARTDNTPNIGELKETIKKYKTFESTLNEFRSEIGYVKETTQILGDTVPDILKDSRTQTGNDIYFNSATPLKANTWYTIVADISGLTAKQETGIYGASGNTNKPIMNSRSFWVVKFPSEQNRVNFYPLGTNTTISNVKVHEGDFTETLQGNLYITHYIHSTDNKWLVIDLNKKLKYKDVVLYFDVDGDITGKTFKYSNALSEFSSITDVEFPLKNKDNVVSVGSFTSSVISLIFSYANPSIKNVRVYEVDYAFRKLTKTQTQNIGTVFKQSAEDIIIAWNNYNKYFSFNNETLDILEKDSYQNKYKKISLTSEGVKIYNDNTLIGTIGTFTHLGQSFRQNTFDIVLTDDAKAFGVYTWQDFSAFGSQVTGYAPLFEIKKDNSGTYRSYFTQPLQTRAVYIDGLNVAENGTSYVGGITKTINVGGRNLRFVQGILVSG